MYKKVLGFTLGAGLLLAGSAYAAPAQVERQAERQEQIAREQIRRGEAMEQEGHRLERQGEWRRGESLERRGENLERHGRRMLNQAEYRAFWIRMLDNKVHLRNWRADLQELQLARPAMKEWTIQLLQAEPPISLSNAISRRQECFDSPASGA